MAGARDHRAADELVRWMLRSAAGTTDAPAPRWTGDAAGLRSALDRHRAWTLLARRARSVAGLPTGLAAEARRHRQLTFTHHLRVRADLDRCARVLEHADLPWAVFKGPLLGELYRRRGDVRAYGDLDLLVSPANLRRALEALLADGATLLDRNFALMRDRLPGEVHLRAPGGTVVDLHWHLVNRPERRTGVRAATDELLSAAVTTAVDGAEVPALHPSDALVHLALHAASSGAGRGQWLLDVALAAPARADGDAWADVVRRARAWEVDRAVGVVLSRVRWQLAAEVPVDVVTALLGRAWSAAEVVTRRGSPSLGPTAPVWAAHLAEGAVEHPSLTALVVRRSLRRLTSRSPRRRFVQSPVDPGSSLFPSGSAADLDAYLDAVATGRHAHHPPRRSRR